MKISLIEKHTKCTRVEVEDAEQLANYIISSDWSPGLYRDNYRSLDNFESMSVIALDFDEGLSLEAACLLFSGYKHVIATTRSHRKKKNEKIEDRFRVVLYLSSPIFNDHTYKATFYSLREKWKDADPACSDASRQFFKCIEVIQFDNEGELIAPVEASPVEAKPKRELSSEERGKLARGTLEFIALGAAPGTVNQRLFKAAKDMQEQGFEEADAEQMLLEALEKQDPLFDKHKSEGTIRSAYRKEAKYEPRGLTTNLSLNKENDKNVTEPNTGILKSEDLISEAIAHIRNPEAIKGISTGYVDLDRLLGGLRQSELGIIQAYPKSGKTVFLQNLMGNLTAIGQPVGFASLEMHPAKQVEPDLYSLLLKKDIRKHGITDEDRSKLEQLFQRGRGLNYLQRNSRPTAEQIVEWARRVYNERGVKFIFVDHLHKFVTDESSVASIGKAITALTGLKYEIPELCIILVVQPTKEQKDKFDNSLRVNKNTLRGGAVIFDECDWLINIHTKYRHFKETEKPWGMTREYFMASYPNDIREVELEAIRAKPFSENMGAKLFFKYDKATTEMKEHVYILPSPETTHMEEREPKKFPQSGWAKNTFGNKRL